MLKELEGFVTSPVAILYGAKIKYPDRLQKVIKPDSPGVPSEYCISPERIFEDLVSLNPKVREIGNMPSGTSALAFAACFTDFHRLPLGFDIDREASLAFVSSVLAQSKDGPVNVAGLYETALEVTDGNFANALITLAAATRQMARAQDTRVTFPVTARQMKAWQKAVSVSMAYNSRYTAKDPAGDVYHLLEACLVGAGRQMEIDSVIGRVSGKPIDTLSWAIPEATRVLRYNICRHEGSVHGTDVVGYETGRALAESLRSPENN